MSVSYISASGASTTTGTTSVVIPAPAGILDNDILLAQIHTEDASAAVTSVPSGFTLLTSYTAAGFRHYIYWKRAASEAGTYTFAATSATFMAGGVQLLRAALQSGDPFTVVGSWGSGTGTTSTAPGITTTSPDSLVLFLGDSENGGNYTVPSGMIERYDGGVYIAELVQSTPGAVSSKAATVSASQEWTSILVAIAPHDGITYIGSASTPADGATATGTSATPAVTPPVGVRVGDIVVFTAMTRDSAGQSFAISQASGQSWSSVNAVANTNIAAGMFWCRFNGTWGSDPSIAVSGGTSPYSAVMHVYRPPFPEATWAVDQAFTELDFTAPGSPFTVTITGQTTTRGHTVTLAGWFTADDNTWGSISGTGWVVPGSAQYRNTSGSDLSATFAHKIQTSAGATGNVSKNQATLGGDAGTTFIVTFYPLLSGTGGGTQGAQTVSSGGTVDIGGAGTPTQGAQTSAGDGSVANVGSGAPSQAPDTLDAEGSIDNTGQGAPAQAADTLDSEGTVGDSAIEGGAAITQDAQTVDSDGTVGIEGQAAPTQAPDSVEGEGELAVGGSASVAAQPDQASSAGEVAIGGEGTPDEADDTAIAAGSVGNTGQGSATQDPDAVEAEASVQNQGAATVTEQPNQAAGDGDVAVDGAAVETQDAQTAEGEATVAIGGAGAPVEGDDTVVSAGSVGNTGQASITQDPQTLEAADETSVTGSGGGTQAPQTVQGSGQVGITAEADVAQQGNIVQAVGTIDNSGEAAPVQAPQISSATGTVDVAGGADYTQESNTAAGVGSSGTPAEVLRSVLAIRSTYRVTALGPERSIRAAKKTYKLAALEPEHSAVAVARRYTVQALPPAA